METISVCVSALRHVFARAVAQLRLSQQALRLQVCRTELALLAGRDWKEVVQ